MSKRSRLVRSSSQGDIRLLKQFQSIESPVSFFGRKSPAPIGDIRKQVEESKPPVLTEENPLGESIFTLGSPEREKIDAWSKTRTARVGFGEFVKVCFSCKKELDAPQDLYMYGFLGAFCSTACREDQFALDGFEEEISKDITWRKFLKMYRGWGLTAGLK